jgi:hypothetical protein
MKICFYTEAHLGDFLFSAPFIKLLIEKYPENEYYQHIYGSHGTVFPEIFMKTVPGLIPTNEICGDINIHTWLCDKQYSELHIPSTENDQTFPGLEDVFFVHKRAWNYIFKKHGFDVKIPNDIGISFDYESILDDQSLKFIQKFGESKRKKVFFINIKGKSGQTDNDDWLSNILHLANLYPDIDFCYMNEEQTKVDKENVIHTPSIFGNHSSDIFHNAYLSTFCDIIVGKNSGAFVAISMHNNNVTNPNKVFISQTQDNVHKKDLEIYFNKKLYKAKNIHTNLTKESFDILEKILCQ